VAGDFLRIEVVERAPEAFPFFQHERPVQSGLCAGEYEDLEVSAVAMNGDTPFAIMIFEQQRVIRVDPGASFLDCTAHSKAFTDCRTEKLRNRSVILLLGFTSFLLLRPRRPLRLL